MSSLHCANADVDAMVHWAELVCTDHFYTTKTIDMALTDLPIRNVSPELESLEEREDEDIDVFVGPLTKGLWITPVVSDPKCLTDFWTCLRASFPAHERRGLVYRLLTERDEAFHVATEAALMVKVCDPTCTGLERMYAQVALEARFTLRRTEMALINFQVHTGLLEIDTRKQSQLYFAVSCLHKIRVHYHDFITHVAKTGGAKVKKGEGLDKHRLLDTLPRSCHSAKELVDLLSYHLRLLTGLHAKTDTFWKPDGRYIFAYETLKPMVKLYDMAVTGMDKVFVAVVDNGHVYGCVPVN
jgi:hypothetical protein